MAGRANGSGTLAASLLVSALGLGLAACETTHSTQLSTPGVAVVTKTEAARAWALVEAGARHGWVVLFEDPDAPDDATRRYYSVRNLHHQELGSMDGHGRAWRFVPHQRDPEWVTTATVLEGARLILNLSPATELEEVQLGEIPGR